jgi:hypothetical protein
MESAREARHHLGPLRVLGDPRSDGSVRSVATGTPGPDAVSTAPKTAPKPLIWRGTTFDFNVAATTTALGIGRDNIGGEGEFAGMEWDLAPNVYVLDLPDDKINVSGDIGAGVELTNSDTTLTRREPYFKDLQAGATYTRNIFTSKDKEWSTKLKVKARLIFPTSKVSIDEGKYLTTSLGTTIGQTFKLLGNGADGLNNLTLTVGVSWQHLFSRAYNPTNPSLERTRQNAHGDTELSDQLTYNSFDIDRLIPTASVDLPLYKDLSLTVSGRLIGRFKHRWQGQDCEAQTLTGCVKADSAGADSITYTTNSTFDISLTQSIFGLVDLDVGYSNETLSLGEDGRYRNPFYSPDAQFYMDVIANIDEIYNSASGRSPAETPTITAANPETRMPSF